MPAEAAVEVLAALAEPMRWRLLALLSAEAQSASALSRTLPVSRTAVQKHLAVLERSDLVRRTRVGREIRYAVHTEPLTSIGRWMAEVAAVWDTRLAALKRLAEDVGDR
ncbi:ArsR/SmtB family transcription factor [Nonomuraea jiangxiensis]|uniref:Helix-turn-helix domain-containing protein n=1 Tax=Nonomuraea jiangxiensis TaxID=633440 RepID=A0A1G8US15_9ACTN|nr:metalloregulator ArsR/SmtB family transcription factor [Nonomuraea jiangxiensis]SDJ56357.1 Helix-turn-helix domain-containing protein [Nonomuraea jiangxiensis]